MRRKPSKRAPLSATPAQFRLFVPPWQAFTEIVAADAACMRAIIHSYSRRPKP